MPGLMNMPREIRYQILELCLLVEGTINPYPALHEDRDQFAKCNQKPDIALLKVNKVLNLEATEIFYEMNTWQLSSPRPLEDPPFEKDLIWKFHSDRISHLRIVMDMYDLPPNTILTAARKADGNSLEDYQRTKFIHERCLEAALETWEWKTEMMVHIKPLTLEIDMKNMYCPIGCCHGQFIDGLAIVMITTVYVSSEGRHDELSTNGSFTNAPTADMSVVGLTKGEERHLISRMQGLDSEGEADGESMEAALRFRIQWREPFR